MTLIAFSLGSNVGDKVANINKAIELLTHRLNLQNVKISSLYLAEPWGIAEQEWFVNAAIAGYCYIEPQTILSEIKSIEVDIGRIKRERWKQREIDIDIIVYGDMIYKSEYLQIPHQSFLDRAFVLAPLSEIIPDFIIPKSDTTITRALEICKDKSQIKKIEKN